MHIKDGIATEQNVTF